MHGSSLLTRSMGGRSTKRRAITNVRIEVAAAPDAEERLRRAFDLIFQVAGQSLDRLAALGQEDEARERSDGE
jgi:hypothetical protein